MSVFLKLIFFCTVFSSAVQCNDKRTVPFSTNTLLIYLDDSETKEMGPVSKGLLSALYSQAAPILTSIVPLKTILSDPEHEAVFKEKSEAAKWLIKKVNADLVLLVPHAYNKKIQEMVKRQNWLIPEVKGVSETALLLGLAIDNLATISFLDQYVQKYTQEREDFGFIAALDTVFIPRRVYASIPNSFVPSWSIFIHGHGMLNESIVGISLQQFQVFLDFLATKINTKLLIYLSCYAAGTNADKIYQDIRTKVYKTYPFAIVTSALTDAPTTSNLIQFDFDIFVERVTSDTVDYVKMVEPVFPYAKGLGERSYNEFERMDIRNVPQIKLPGIPWFNIIDTTKRVVSLGKVLAQTRKDALDILSYFKIEKPLGILLYTNYVPFTLSIRLDTMPQVILMEQGSYVYIEGITVNTSLDNFLKAFEIIKDSGIKRTIFIKNLTLNADAAKKQLLTNFVMVMSNKSRLSGEFEPLLQVYNFAETAQGVEGQEYDAVRHVWTGLSSQWAQRLYANFVSDIERDITLQEIKGKRDLLDKAQKLLVQQAKGPKSSEDLSELLMLLEQRLHALSYV